MGSRPGSSNLADIARDDPSPLSPPSTSSPPPSSVPPGGGAELISACLSTLVGDGSSHPTIRLPPSLVKALTSPPPHAIPHDRTRCASMVLAVADTGATHHMIPDKSAFVSYHRVNKQVRMGNGAYAPVLGRGTAVFALNGHTVLIRNVLHVPALRVPLYSRRAHLKQRGCGFVGDNSLGGMFVYFPSFFISVDTSEDCHLQFRSLGVAASLKEVEYGQPRSEASASRVTTRSWSKRAAEATQVTGIIRNALPGPDAVVPPVASPQTEKTVRWKQPVSAETLPGPCTSEVHPRALPRGDGGGQIPVCSQPGRVSAAPAPTRHGASAGAPL